MWALEGASGTEETTEGPYPDSSVDLPVMAHREIRSIDAVASPPPAQETSGMEDSEVETEPGENEGPEMVDVETIDTPAATGKGETTRGCALASL